MKYNVCTNIDVGSIELSWDILNYSFNDKTNEEHLKTPVLRPNKRFSFYLLLYPKGRISSQSGFVSLWIVFTMKNSNIKVEYSFAILDSKENEVNQYSKIDIIDNTLMYGTDTFIKIPDLKQYLINDKLTIVCKLRAGITNETSLNPELKMLPSIDKLSQDFEILLEKQKFTDVILAVKGKTFNAHKAILSARSCVFAALFEHEMQENITSRVDIEDTEPNVIEEMLHFIYTGKVKDLNLIAWELLMMSNKYFLEGLKSICEDTLSKSLTVDNVLQILSLADLHNAKALKTIALKFSITHAKAIIQTSAFKSAENLNVQILSDLFQEFALKCNI